MVECMLLHVLFKTANSWGQAALDEDAAESVFLKTSLLPSRVGLRACRQGPM